MLISAISNYWLTRPLRAELSDAAAQHLDDLQDTSTIKLQREVAKLIEDVEWDQKDLEEALDAARVQISCAGMVLVSSCIIDNHCLTHFLSRPRFYKDHFDSRYHRLARHTISGLGGTHRKSRPPEFPRWNRDLSPTSSLRLSIQLQCFDIST
jgi:hypothetical protein